VATEEMFEGTKSGTLNSGTTATNMTFTFMSWTKMENEGKLTLEPLERSNFPKQMP
jgi:hypothetical protein